MSVNQIFEELAANNSRLFKLDYLKQQQDNALLRDVIHAALDTFTQYYIRKIPEYKQIESTDIGLSEALNQLGYLSKRIYTGNKGIEHLRSILCNLPPDSAKVIERIIAKDLKCGVSISTTNEIWPGLIHEYPCMLCSGYEEKLVNKIPFPAYVQLKMDGMRFNAIVRSGKVEFRSRNGKEIDLLGFLEDEFKELADGNDIVFDGELTVIQGSQLLDRQTGNGILNKASKGTIKSEEAALVNATIWDAIPYEYFMDGYYDRKYSERFVYLTDQTSKLSSAKIKVVPNNIVNNVEEVNKLFAEYYAAGEEGIILKSVDGIWENKRSKHQIKYKGELDTSLIVVGVEEGSGKYKGMLGAFICESADGTLRVNVGSGLTDENRKEFWEVKPIGSIISIKYNSKIKSKTGEWSLFLPIFIGERLDQESADLNKDIK